MFVLSMRLPYHTSFIRELPIRLCLKRYLVDVAFGTDLDGRTALAVEKSTGIRLRLYRRSEMWGKPQSDQFSTHINCLPLGGYQ